MKVEVVSYNPNWPKMFKEEQALLCKHIGSVIESIHHVGSTAVPGLAAKPVIDILVVARSLEELDDKRHAFEELNYEAMGEFGILGRRYYRKGGDHLTHQVHAFKAGNKHIARHLAFKDYLRAHPAVQKEYEKLKIELAKAHPDDIEAYVEGKDDFIKHYEAEALKWRAGES